MDDDQLQVKPTNAERLLWEFPILVAFVFAAWVLSDYVRESVSSLTFVTVGMLGMELGKRIALRAANRRWDREANIALNRESHSPPP